MTQEEIQIIIDSDIPSFLKSALIKSLIDLKNESARMFKEGGEVEEEKPKVKEESEQTYNLPEPDAEVTIGDKDYKVCIADTPEKRKEGLSKCKHLPEDGGMLFVFEESTNTPFTMAETSINLDIIFIDEEGEVLEVHSVKAMDPEPVQPSEEYCYVLEVNYGSGVLEGDSVEMRRIDEEEDDESDSEKELDAEDKKHVNSRMLVLNSKGDVQAIIEAGCRIFSRISTRKMIRKALLAFKSDNDEDYKKVGKYVCYELNLLDLRSPQYTEAPKNDRKEESNE